MAREFLPPETCPVCGEDVPPGAKACPACGADERTGWNEDATRYDGLDLPDEAFTDKPEPASRRITRGRLWLVVGAGLLVLLILGLILR